MFVFLSRSSPLSICVLFLFISIAIVISSPECFHPSLTFSTSTSLSSSLLLHLSKAFLSFVNSSFHILALNTFSFIVDVLPSSLLL